SREPDEAIGMLAYELGHGVVGDPRELDAFLRLGEELNRRRRQRQYLLILREHVHYAEADVEIVQHRHAPAAFADVLQIAGKSFDPFRIARWGDVGEYVDLAHRSSGLGRASGAD